MIIKKTIKRLKRAPIPAVAVLLFAAVISAIICALHASNKAELRNYEEMWQTVPVTVTVTRAVPSESDSGLYWIQDWVYYLFTRENPVSFFDVSDAKDMLEGYKMKKKVTPQELSLTEYVKDVQVKMSKAITTINERNYSGAGGATILNGITSLSCDKQLLPEYGCEITWYDGCDESIFEAEELLCLIPEAMSEKYDNGNGEIVLDFTGQTMLIEEIDGKEQLVQKTLDYQCTLKIAGTYTAGDEKSIYCPFPIIVQVFTELDATYYFDSLSATLADNRRLEEFREKASFCFLEPSPNPEATRWGFFANHWWQENYKYALNIDDNNLFELAAILEDSIKFNRTVTVFVVALSVVAGFLIGFLMIRRRKRDIFLMRMVGESNAMVYVGFVLEQMICVILGIVLGGAYYKWDPIKNLAIFAIVYFIGLTLALAIFMSKKLIKNVKEDE